jgi:hypothetical protein
MLKDAQILRNYLSNHQITQGDLAEKLKMTRQNLVYHLSKDKFTTDFKDKLQEIGIGIFKEKKPFLFKDQLDLNDPIAKNFGNHTEAIPDPYTLSPEGKLKKKKVIEGFSQIPYYDVDFAAGNLELSDVSSNKPSYMMDIPIFHGCAAFNVYSDSMESLIKAGNIMFCSKLKDWESHLEFGQIYAVSMNDNRRYLKYIKKSKDDTKFLLESANEFYEPFEIPKSKIRSIWLVEGWMAKKTQ